MMRLSLRKLEPTSTSRAPGSGARTAADLRPGEGGVLESLDLSEDVARRLMELGFVPGHRVVAAHRAPGGDPRVYRVDGSEIALRRETASHLLLRAAATGDDSGGSPAPGDPLERR